MTVWQECYCELHAGRFCRLLVARAAPVRLASMSELAQEEVREARRSAVDP